MKIKIKKSIAKEGLILLSIVILGLAVYFISKHLNDIYLIRHQEVKFKVVQGMKYALIGYAPYIKVMSLGLSIAVFGYPVIAAIRFVLWAVRALKEK